MSRRLSGDFVRYVPALAIPIAAGTISTVVFSRLCSPEEFGTFLLVSALTTSLGYLSGYWLYQALLRFYPAYLQEGRQDRLIRTVSILASASGGAATLIVVLLLWSGVIAVHLQVQLLLPAAAMTFFTVTSTWQTHLLQARFAVVRYSAFYSASAAGKLLFPLLLFPAVGGVAALLWGNAIVAILGWGVLSMQRFPGPDVESSGGGDAWQISREVAAFGLPLSISEIGVQALTYSDRYVIAALLGTGAVGLYSTNYSIAEKLLILVQAPLIHAAHVQIMSEWGRKNYAGAHSLLSTATRWLILCGSPMVAFTAVRSQMISDFVLGEAFAAGHLVLPITAASGLVWALSQFGQKPFELAKDTWVITGSLLTAACVNVVSAIILTATVGYLGGAIATAIGFGVHATIIFVISRRRGVFRWSIPWKTCGAATLGAVGAAMIWSLLVPDRLTGFRDLVGAGAAGLLGLGVYALLVSWLGELPQLSGISRPLGAIVARLRNDARRNDGTGSGSRVGRRWLE